MDVNTATAPKSDELVDAFAADGSDDLEFRVTDSEVQHE